MKLASTLPSTRVQCHPAQPLGLCPRHVRVSRKVNNLHNVPSETLVSRGPACNVVTRFKEERGAESADSSQMTADKPSQRNIVLALDATSESDACVEWAVDNLLRAGDEAHVLHMVPGVPAEHVFSLPAGRLLHVTTAVASAMEDHLRGVYAARARELCARLGPRLSAAQVGLHVHVVPQTGGASKGQIGMAICEQAEALKAAAVVVASHSHGGLAEFIRGSVAHYAVQHCSRPVAVLHEPMRGLPKVSTQRTSGQWHTTHGGSGSPAPPTGRQLVVAVDSTDDSLAACRWILDNMYRKGDTLHLLHVVPCLPAVLPVSGADLLMDASMGYSTSLGSPDLADRQRELAMGEAREWEQMQSYGNAQALASSSYSESDADEALAAVKAVASASAAVAASSPTTSSSSPAASKTEDENSGGWLGGLARAVSGLFFGPGSSSSTPALSDSEGSSPDSSDWEQQWQQSEVTASPHFSHPLTLTSTPWLPGFGI